MPKKIAPTAAQKRVLFIHAAVFAALTIAMWVFYKMEGARTGKWVYPWQAWITAAWGLALIGHWCALYTSYEDKGMNEYQRQTLN